MIWPRVDDKPTDPRPPRHDRSLKHVRSGDVVESTDLGCARGALDRKVDGMVHRHDRHLLLAVVVLVVDQDVRDLHRDGGRPRAEQSPAVPN